MVRNPVASALLVLGLVGFGCSEGKTTSKSFGKEYCELIEPCCSTLAPNAKADDCRLLLGLAEKKDDFDAEKATLCVTKTREASASATFCQDLGAATVGTTCDGVFGSALPSLGTTSSGSPAAEAPTQARAVAPGGACATEFECALVDGSTVTCAFTEVGQPSVCVVARPGSLGEGPCRSETEDGFAFEIVACDDGSFCTSADNVCAARVPAGSECSPTEFNCTLDSRCQPPAGDPGGTPTCVPRAAVGDPCETNRDDDCAVGTRCVAAGASTNGTCKRELEDGEACSADEATLCKGKLCIEGKCASAENQNPGTVVASTALPVLCGLGEK